MTEQALNTIVGNSLSWKFKIPDLGSKNPFDGFGIHSSTPIYWESKNLKQPKAFNLKDIADHQIANLKAIQDLAPTTLTLLLVAVDYGRAQKRVYVFKDMSYINDRRIAKRNIFKKEFDARRNYVLIEKQLIDFNKILEMPREWEYEEK